MAPQPICCKVLFVRPSHPTNGAKHRKKREAATAAICRVCRGHLPADPQQGLDLTQDQLNLRVGRLKDEGKGRHPHTSMAKMNATGKALEIARMARDLHGAKGITLEYPIIRHMNNLESLYTYEGTYDIHLLILGQEITGIPAFR